MIWEGTKIWFGQRSRSQSYVPPQPIVTSTLQRASEVFIAIYYVQDCSAHQYFRYPKWIYQIGSYRSYARTALGEPVGSFLMLNTFVRAIRRCHQNFTYRERFTHFWQYRYILIDKFFLDTL